MSRLSWIVSGALSILVLVLGIGVVIQSNAVDQSDENVSDMAEELRDIELERSRLQLEKSRLELRVRALESELQTAEKERDKARAKNERNSRYLSELRYGIKEIAVPVLANLPSETAEDRLNKVRLDLFYIFSQVFQGRKIAWGQVAQALDEIRALFPVLNQAQRNALARAVFSCFSDSDVLSDAFTGYQMNRILGTMDLFAQNENLEM